LPSSIPVGSGVGLAVVLRLLAGAVGGGELGTADAVRVGEAVIVDVPWVPAAGWRWTSV
jgi:hypothetical protein